MIDGRGLVVPEYPDGNFVGPTLIHNMTTRHIISCLKIVLTYRQGHIGMTPGE